MFLCPLFSLCYVCTAPGLTEGFDSPFLNLALGRKMSLPFCRRGWSSEEYKEAYSQPMCQVKWRGQGLNSNLFSLGHVLLV